MIAASSTHPKVRVLSWRTSRQMIASSHGERKSEFFLFSILPLSPVVQHECIPQAILGMDIICQAKSGMGKTAVFVLATLQQIEAIDGQVSVLVLCHVRELAFQIYKEYERFSKYFDGIKCSVFFGGMPISKDKETLKNKCPHIVVGTPGRILALIREKDLNLKHVKHFILDECDKMLEQLGVCVCVRACVCVCVCVRVCVCMCDSD